MNSILITGGAGFIGTHTSLVLIEQGFRVILIDSFSNSSKRSIQDQAVADKPLIAIDKNQNTRDKFIVQETKN